MISDYKKGIIRIIIKEEHAFLSHWPLSQTTSNCSYLQSKEHCKCHVGGKSLEKSFNLLQTLN